MSNAKKKTLNLCVIAKKVKLMSPSGSYNPSPFRRRKDIMKSFQGRIYRGQGEKLQEKWSQQIGPERPFDMGTQIPKKSSDRRSR